jgi:large subunit ribosomal protein L10
MTAGVALRRPLISRPGEDEKQSTALRRPLFSRVLRVFACKSGKDFLLKGGEYTLAISKVRKQDILATYESWMQKSQAVILVEYTGAKMKDMDAIRAKVRETGGEFHVVKNTLARRVFAAGGMSLPDGLLERSTAVSFAFTDPAATAKALSDATRNMEFIRVKGGFMGGQMLNASQVKALSELPSLPVVRAQLLGVLQAPAGKLVRTIAEPARSLAAVFRAYSEKAPASA